MIEGYLQAIFDLLELSTRWMQATAALMQLAPQPRVNPPTAAYYAACMVRAEQEYNVPWPRLAAIIQHESQWRPGLVSRTNDYGLGQHHCPSFFCGRRPTAVVKAALLDPCTNISLTAEELVRQRARCKKNKNCKDYVKLYNPGNPTYAAQIHKWEARFRHAAKGPRQVKLAME